MNILCLDLSSKLKKIKTTHRVSCVYVMCVCERERARQMKGREGEGCLGGGKRVGGCRPGCKKPAGGVCRPGESPFSSALLPLRLPAAAPRPWLAATGKVLLCLVRPGHCRCLVLATPSVFSEDPNLTHTCLNSSHTGDAPAQLKNGT